MSLTEKFGLFISIPNISIANIVIKRNRIKSNCKLLNLVNLVIISKDIEWNRDRSRTCASYFRRISGVTKVSWRLVPWFTCRRRSPGEKKSGKGMLGSLEKERMNDFLIISWLNKLLFASFAAYFHRLRWIFVKLVYRKLSRQLHYCLNARNTGCHEILIYHEDFLKSLKICNFERKRRS